MKQSMIRLFSAVILMGVALAVSVAMIGAVSDREAAQTETPQGAFVWIKMLFAAEPQIQEIRLYSADGIPVQTLRTDRSGMAVSELMVPGKYYAFTQHGCTEFTLHANASVSTEGGCGWSDGEMLHLTSAQVGTVTVERPASEQTLSQNNGWLDYTLKNDETERREVIRCKTAGELLRCTFEGVPYGTYVLEENGVEQCKVVIGENETDITVSLP